MSLMIVFYALSVVLRYLKQSLYDESKSPLIKPQIDERLLEILHENGVIPPYKSKFRIQKY